MENIGVVPVPVLVHYCNSVWINRAGDIWKGAPCKTNFELTI